MGTLTQFCLVIGIFVSDVLAFPFATEDSWHTLYVIFFKMPMRRSSIQEQLAAYNVSNEADRVDAKMLRSGFARLPPYRQRHVTMPPRQEGGEGCADVQECLRGRELDVHAFSVRPWPVPRHGRFHRGDSYIVLRIRHSSYGGGRLWWDIYF